VTWDKLGDWWIKELADDPAYDEEIRPLVLDLLRPLPGHTYLDVGCGEGRMMSDVVAAGSRVVGCDLNPLLLHRARVCGPVVRGELPSLAWARESSFDGAYVVLVLEHLEDEVTFFREVAGAVRSGGALAIVINHPVWTAPDSSPIEDPGGEILWRPGTYFGRGFSDEPAGRRKVRFYHRTMADLVSAASSAEWDLIRMVEMGISQAQIDRLPGYAGQEHMPRLMGGVWRRR
jgi:SAM-dependent methyltransferase